MPVAFGAAVNLTLYKVSVDKLVTNDIDFGGDFDEFLNPVEANVEDPRCCIDEDLDSGDGAALEYGIEATWLMRLAEVVALLCTAIKGQSQLQNSKVSRLTIDTLHQFRK